MVVEIQADRWRAAWRRPPLLQIGPSNCMCGFVRRAASESRAPTMLEPMMVASLDVITFLKVSWLHFSCLMPHVSGQTLDLDIPDRTMEALSVSLTLWEHRLGTRDAWRGLLVERCFIYNVDDDRSRLRGAAGSRRRACDTSQTYL